MTVRRHCILLVDDEPAYRALLSEALVRAGFEVIEASNGAEAIERMNPEVALVISEIQMPLMDGFSLASIVTKTRPDVPVFIVSADPIFPGAIPDELGVKAAFPKVGSLTTIVEAAIRVCSNDERIDSDERRRKCS